ncbi:hypothetical protein [Ornithinibacillus salinisoli]
MTESGFDKKINEFLNNSSKEIVDIKFSMTIFDYGAMSMYRDIEK